MLVDRLEGFQQAVAAFGIEGIHAFAQLGNGAGEVGLFGLLAAHAFGQLLGLGLGFHVHTTERIAVAAGQHGAGFGLALVELGDFVFVQPGLGKDQQA